MYEFSVTTSKEMSYAILRSKGYINNLGGEKLAFECYQLLEEGYSNLIINLQESRLVNSIGISILIEVIEKILEKQGHLAFTNLTPTVAKTFRIMGLLHYAALFNDESEARNHFEQLTS